MNISKEVDTRPETTPPIAVWWGRSLLWPYVAAKFATDACLWWLKHEIASAGYRHEAALPWTTPNEVVLELQSMRLRDFSRNRAGRPALICTPYAQHGALIADLAPSHSIVEALQRGGLDRVLVTEWRSASSDMRFLSIDNYLADLNVAVDEIGTPVDLVGLCQGGWLSLIYAAHFPVKVRRLVLVGTPVDVSVESGLSRAVACTPPSALEALVNSAGDIVRGDGVLAFLGRALDVELDLQRSLSPDIPSENELLDRFSRWDSETLDLPGAYYLQVVNWIFRENRLATGCFMALGRQVHLDQVKMPIFLLVGAHDKVVPANQALATAALLGTPAGWIERVISPSTHLGLFIGSRTLASYWPRVAAWLRAEHPALRSRGVASA